MHQVTVPMAIMDYLPVICFGITAVLLLMDLYDKMQKGAFSLFAAGTIDIFAAGLLKATWKLLYAADICGFQVLNTMFLPVQSLGFLLAGLGMILMFCAKKPAMMAAAPLLFSGKVIFIMMMVLGLGSICTCLNILAVKLRKKAAVFLFIFAFWLPWEWAPWRVRIPVRHGSIGLSNALTASLMAHCFGEHLFSTRPALSN